MAAVVFRSIKGLDTPGAVFVEFCAEFSDGTSACTNNSPEPPMGPASERHVVLRYRRVKDVARLLSLHREAVRRFGRGARKPRTSTDWWTGALLDSLRRYADHMVASGWFAPRGEDGYGLTLKGALLGTWTNLPPWLWLRRTTVGARERQVGHVMGV